LISSDSKTPTSRVLLSDAVEDADGGPQGRQRPVGGHELVAGEVQRRPVAEVDPVVGRGRPAQEAFEVEAAAAVLRAVVGDQLGVLGPHLLDAGAELLLDRGEEGALLVADQLGRADDPDGVAAGGDGHRRADEPLLAPHDDSGARGEHGIGGHGGSPRHVSLELRTSYAGRGRSATAVG
jgi:hypothetical protein